MGGPQLDRGGTHRLRGRPARRVRPQHQRLGDRPGRDDLHEDQQDRDVLARELLVKFPMSPRYPLLPLKEAYKKF
jgi:hypothetical protein